MSEKDSAIEFQTNRIVCIDSPRANLHLFAEVIETITSSSRCWVKPLAIASFNPDSYRLELLHDLRDTAQLILPIDRCRDALDTEVLPLISELFHSDNNLIQPVNTQKILYQFIADLYRSP